jgi:LCP family protein required for cell wall assembly
MRKLGRGCLRVAVGMAIMLVLFASIGAGAWGAGRALENARYNQRVERRMTPLALTATAMKIARAGTDSPPPAADTASPAATTPSPTHEGVAQVPTATITASSPVIFATNTPLATNTPAATNTPEATNTPLSSPTPQKMIFVTNTPEPESTASFTPWPTNTARPTFTPTNTVLPSPTFTPTFPPIPTVVNYAEYATPSQPSDVPVPSPYPMLQSTEYDIVNVLLYGIDQRPGDLGFNTDTLIVVSINRTVNAVTMLSIPRDLFVYVPGWRMAKINQALVHGRAVGWSTGALGLLKETIQYNLGIPIHFTAGVDFKGFVELIDLVGGVDLAVDCPFAYAIPLTDDWASSELEDWDDVEMDIGMHHLDGFHALWFARWRKGHGDFVRSRHQQQVLWAAFRKAKDLDMLGQIPQLWNTAMEYVQTDMTLGDVLGLLPVALQLDTSRIRSLTFSNWYVEGFRTSNGLSALLPQAEPVEYLLDQFYKPPTLNQIFVEGARIAVYNGTPNADWDRVAADRLAWEGFVPVAMGPWKTQNVPATQIIDYSGRTKGSSLTDIMEALNIAPKNVTIQPDPNSEYDFRVILGAGYDSCD